MVDALKEHGVPEFIDRHGWDPSDLLNGDWVSDYYSEPEDASETKEDWKLRMARANGMDVDQMDANQLAKLKFWERAHPAWRSKKVHIQKPLNSSFLSQRSAARRLVSES